LSLTALINSLLVTFGKCLLITKAEDLWVVVPVNHYLLLGHDHPRHLRPELDALVTGVQSLHQGMEYYQSMIEL
jgi:hypothetical protein